MDVVRNSRRIAISSIAVFALLAHPARADTRNLALVRCDMPSGELIVKEDSTEDEVENYKTPDGFQLKWLDDLVEYISPPGTDDATSGTYRHKVADWQLSCTLIGAVYTIIVSPWSVNDMVNGECGGGDPDLAVTIRRGNRLLVKDFELGGNCSIGSNSVVFIGSIKLSEPKQIAMLDERPIPYSEMPTFNRKRLSANSVVDSAPVMALPTNNDSTCNQLESQQQTSACAKSNFDATDRELNQVFKKLRAALTPAQQVALVHDERRWLKSLDTQCHTSANDESGGTSVVSWQCRTEITKLRVEALRHWEP